MFRLIKKWYFKIYHLFKLLGIFILVFGIRSVYAEEYNECFNEYKIGTVTFQNQSTYFKYIKPEIEVESDTTYYIRFFPTGTFTSSNNTFFGTSGYFYNSNHTGIGNLAYSSIQFDNTTNILTIHTPNNSSIAYVVISVYTYNTTYTVLQDNPFIYSTNIEDVTTCPSTPEPEESVYSTFLGLYVEKIQYLAEGFIENQYLFSMVAIIFAWVVLEMFLKILHLRGGYKK